jgi:hypothetical protein
MGSLQEWCLIFLLDRLEDIEHAKFRALAQLQLDQESGVKAFEDYLNIAFPGLAMKRKKRDEESKKVLDWWTGLGGLKVRPMIPERGKSRVKVRMAQGAVAERAEDIYRKLKPHEHRS